MADLPIKINEYESNEALAGTDLQEVYQGSSGGIRREKKASLATLKTFYSGDIQTSLGALEIPTNGEAIAVSSGDELFLEGVKSNGVTSKGNFPVIWTEDYAPAILNVDGSEVANPIIKFPNRGVHGFFGSYTNIWQEPFIIGNSAAITQQGDWTCIENTTGTSQGYLRKDLTANTTSIYGTFKIRKGSTGVIQVNIPNFTPTLAAFIFNLNTQTFVPIAGTFDELSYVEYEAGQLYEVHFRISGGSGSSQSVFIYGTQGTTIGDYNCYKDIMIVEEVSYRVPYVEGIHQQSYGVFNYNWSNASAWTIEGWLNPVTLDSGRTILDATDDSFKNGIILQINTSNKLELLVADATSGAFLSGTIAENTFVHFKIIIKVASVAFYINGSLIGTSSSIVPTIDDMPKLLWIGQRSDTTNKVKSCYFAELCIKPYEDTSTTHYTSGLPYYDPNATYGENGLFKINQNGDLCANSISLINGDGSQIHEIYTDGINVVIKYESGIMEQYGYEAFSSIAITTASGSLYRNATASDLTITFLEEFTEIIDIFPSIKGTVNASNFGVRSWTESTTNFYNYVYSSTSNTNNVTIKYYAIGRWK